MTLQITTSPTIEVNYRDILLDMRGEILLKMMLIVAGFALIGAYLTLLERPFPTDKCALFLSLAVGVYAMRRVNTLQSNLSRYALVVMLHVYLLVGVVIIHADWVILLSVPLVLMSGLLVSNSSIISAGVILIGVAGLNMSGIINFPLDVLLMMLSIILSMTLTTISTFYVTVSWYSAMHDRADRLLQQARDRRAELLQILKSLDTAYLTQQRLQQQLIYARQKANEARLLKERFAANISHELRTPLNLILGFSEIMYLNPEVYGDIHLSPRFVRDIHQIYGNSKYLLDLIDDILDLSHIEMSNFTINFEPTDMNTFMQESIGLMQNLFRNSEVDLILDIHRDLPTMEIDRTRMRQILLNLLTNAQRFTEAGHVMVQVYATERDLILQVSDTGKGIPDNKLDQIFDEFYQVDYSLSRRHGGAGLGLTITRRFVEAHDGTIHVQSEVDVGTVFIITLPIVASHQQLVQLPEYSRPENKQCIAVINADASIIAMLKRYLQAYIIVPVPSRDDLSTTIDMFHPIAVIHNNHKREVSDVPALLNGIPLIECSLPSIRWFVDELGVLDCLPKPISSDKLRDTIRQIPRLKSILIVDDDMGFVQLVQRTIEMLPQQYTIMRAYDGLQALELIAQTPPDLILLDIAMPEMNGFEVISTLQENPTTQDIPIILLTATRYIESEFESNTSLTVHKGGGLNTSEVIKSIQNLLDALL